MKDAASLSGKQKSDSGGRTTGNYVLRLWQVVHLQPDRTSTGPLYSVDHFYHVTILQGARRLNEHSLLDPLIFRNVRRGFHSYFVGVLLPALLKRLLKFGRQFTRIVHRTHSILIELQLQIGSY